MIIITAFLNLQSPIRLATHISDLDGISSAALFIRAAKMNKKTVDVTYLNVEDAQNNHQDFDYVTDLPKIGNAINIDHHQSNYNNLQAENRLTENDIVKPHEPAATKLVYEYLYLECFKDDLIAKQIHDMAVLADQGKIPPSFATVDLLIKYYCDNPSKLSQISKLLADEGDALPTNSWILAEYKQITEIVTKTQNYFSELFKIEHTDIILVDVVDAIDQKFAKEAIRPAFNSGVKVLGILFHQKHVNNYSISFRVADSAKADFDLQKVAEKLGGGGHKVASGARGTNRVKLRKAVALELKELAKMRNVQFKEIILHK